MSDLTFYCTWCRRRLVIDESGAGVELPCPVCKKTITIPPKPVWLPAINEALRKIVQDNLSGRVGNARVRLREAILAAGYDPTKARVQPNGPEDLMALERLDLVLRTNHVIALNHEQFVQDNQQSVVDEWPAWEFIRPVPRGPPDHNADTAINWHERWQQAAAKAGDDSALRVFKETGRMVALVDSGIWDALGRIWDDSLGNPFPPFAWGSSYGTAGIGREEAVALRLLEAATVIRPRIEIRPPTLIPIEDERITEYLWSKPAPCEHCGEDKPARRIHRCDACGESICPDCAAKGCNKPEPPP